MSIETLCKADVVVVGAGSAGCCAAISAAEAGRSVVLIERYGFAGGTSTQILDTFYGFFTPGDQPRKVVGGVPDRVVDALDATGDVFLRPNTYGAGTGVTYNPERLKLVWDRLLESSGVKVLLHTWLTDVELDQAGQLAGVVVHSKAGFHRIAGRRFIDASGDADLCHLAGFDYEKAGELDPAQTLTTTFRMSSVDLDAFEAAGGKTMLMERMAEAVERGRHALPRKKGSAHRMVHDGCIATVAVRVGNTDATDPESLTSAEIEGRRQAFVYEDFLRDMVPGYENAKIIGLSHHIGVRETRRVYGESRLTREQCLSGTQFDDQVLLCGAPIEDHRQNEQGEDETAWAYVEQGGVYGVPYGTLVPTGRDDAWVVGRCFSATHDAHASCRSMGQTMSTGQAAGTAAALAVESDLGARDVPIGTLQSRLQSIGAVLEPPQHVAEVAADAWRHNRRTGAVA
ncbi:MAG: FAD-dependent oxidoreductase [Planctomycetota bacterium]